MRWLVTGAAGMLGGDVVERIARTGAAVTGVDRDELDITSPAAVEHALAGYDVVVNCAAWTAVDQAESQEPEAFAVNALGPQNLARAARLHDARLVHLSTDYVFSGDARSPYPEHATLAPRSAYGRTKAAGEWAVRAEHPDGHLVLRTAWLYGAGGGCFPKTMLRLAQERGALQVVDDQVGQPTWTRDVADLLVRLVDAGAPAGTYHATSSGETSWFEFARATVVAGGLDASVVAPTTSDAFVRPAPRPAYSVLGHDALAALGVSPIGDWRDRWSEAAAEVLAGD